MKKVFFALFIILTISTVILSQRSSLSFKEPKAVINNQIGRIFIRENKNSDGVLYLKKSSVGKRLVADQQIRCDNNSTLEIKLCTGKIVSLAFEGEDEWYSVPDILCKTDDKPTLIPSFQPGLPGRWGVFRYYDNNEIIRIPDENDNQEKRTTSIVTPTRSGIDEDVKPDPYEERRTSTAVTTTTTSTDGYRNSERKGAILGAFGNLNKPNVGSILGSTTFTGYTYYGKEFATPKYSDNRNFMYPYNNAYVAPKLFIFDIFENSVVNKERKLHLLITLSAYETNSIRISSVWTKELFFQNGIWTNASGSAFNPSEVRSFLENARKYSSDSAPRIFCEFNVAETNKSSNSDIKPQTLGFQFYLIGINDEKALIEQLELSNKDKGITRYLNRADLFEKLGLIKNAIDEYKQALKAFPENEVIESRLEAIQRIYLTLDK